jgi:hypothetical protein
MPYTDHFHAGTGALLGRRWNLWDDLSIIVLDTSAIESNCNFHGAKKSLVLKTHRVVLNGFGVVFVNADGYVETETLIAFHRSASVSAEYPRAMVKEVIEVFEPQMRRHEPLS